MLVLTRKKEEKITIGKNREIIITILKIQGDKVSIGIEADPETPVYRSELLTRERKKENEPVCIKTLQIDIEKEQQLTPT
ncbi:MAG TPA: carbon storage regulator [Parachlamydiaceae bacterium]|nr:carbon storage regulator [Parachlamydiaceae bacterium]